jgi:hypothetical protein
MPPFRPPAVLHGNPEIDRQPYEGDDHMTIRSMSASMSNADISHTLLDDFAPDRWTPHQKKMHDEFRQWVKTLSAHTAAARADVARDTDLNPDGKQRKDAAIVAKATAEIAAIAAVADVHAKTAADLLHGIKSTATAPATGATALPVGATSCVISVEGAGIRWRDDGVPTAAIGMPVGNGSSLLYTGPMASLQIIQQAASAIVNVAYYA